MGGTRVDPGGINEMEALMPEPPMDPAKLAAMRMMAMVEALRGDGRGRAPKPVAMVGGLAKGATPDVLSALLWGSVQRLGTTGSGE
jgi:hypothetical protein